MTKKTLWTNTSTPVRPLLLLPLMILTMGVWSVVNHELGLGVPYAYNGAIGLAVAVLVERADAWRRTR